MTLREEAFSAAVPDNQATHDQPHLVNRRSALLMLGGSAVSTLAACSPTLGPGPMSPGALPQPTVPAISGETLGSGSVRVALLLPKSAPGNGATLAFAMQNAASLGLSDFTANDLTVVVKDSKGTPDGAAAAAQAAISEGAELIIGPVFGVEVGGAGPVARNASVPVIAFSSDPSVAASGVFVLGFMIDGQVQRVLSQAASAGKRSVAGIMSDSAFGNLSEAALRQAAGRFGLRLVQIERFTGGDFSKAVAAVAANASQIDCILVPEGPGVAPQLAASLKGAGVDTARVKLLGTGVWNDPSILGNPALAGAWFPSPEISGFANFASRYRASYGAEPPITASLAYDAVVLAAGLVKTAGAQRFQLSVLTNPQGFLSSVNGLFRFNSNGTNDRGLAVYEITGTSPSLVSPAPRAFTGA